MRILIVRPAPGNAPTAAAVAAMGLDPIVIPLFEVGPRAWDAPDPAAFDAVAMTSANAARHGGAGLARFTHLPVFAVGDATAEAAKVAGFRDVRVGSGDVDDLGTLLKPLPFRGGVGVGTVNAVGASAPADSPHPNPFRPALDRPGDDLGRTPEGEGLKVLHLTGTDYRSIPSAAAVTVVSVYETRPLAPSVPLKADIALIHSPRAGSRLAELMPDRSATHIVAISTAAAQACGSGWAGVHVAEAPREHAVLECLRRLCEASPPN